MWVYYPKSKYNIVHANFFIHLDGALRWKRYKQVHLKVEKKKYLIGVIFDPVLAVQTV